MGFGDWLMLSGRVRELRISFPDAKVVVSPEMEKSAYFREVFRQNPYVTLLSNLAPNEPHIGLSGYLPGVVSSDGRKMSWLDNFQALRGDLFFAADEITFARQAVEEARSHWQTTHPTQRSAPLVVLHPWAKRRQLYANGRVEEYHFAINKEWGIEKYNELAARLADRALLVQFVPQDVENNHVLKGVHQIKCLSFRHAAAVLKQSDLYVGVEGGLHHAAAAVGRPGVVIFGGWISPKTTGYPYHENIYVGDIHAPCGALYECGHCKACMDRISVESVLDRIAFLLDGRGA